MSSISNLRWPPTVLRQRSAPASAHRLTVDSLTSHISASSLVENDCFIASSRRYFKNNEQPEKRQRLARRRGVPRPHGDAMTQRGDQSTTLSLCPSLAVSPRRFFFL